MKKILLCYLFLFSLLMAEFKVDVLPILDLEPGTTAYVNFSYFVHNTAGDKKIFLKPISFDKGLNLNFDPD